MLDTVGEDDRIWIPDEPDWAVRPRMRVDWETSISAAITGGEARKVLRPIPRETMLWTVNPDTVGERSLCLARLRQALKEGYAAAPLWTRPQTLLTIDGGGDQITIETGGYDWQVGDRMAILLQSGNLSRRQIDVVEQSGDGTAWIYTLSATILPDHAPGDAVWPILIGRFGLDGQAQLLSPDVALFGLWIRRDLGRLRYVGPPAMVWFTDFEEFPVGIIDEFDTDTWPEQIGIVFLPGSACYDDFEAYIAGEIAALTAGTSAGVDWIGPGACYFPMTDEVWFSDDFESYDIGAIATLLNGTAYPIGYTFGPSTISGGV